MPLSDAQKRREHLALFEGVPEMLDHMRPQNSLPAMRGQHRDERGSRGGYLHPAGDREIQTVRSESGNHFLAVERGIQIRLLDRDAKPLPPTGGRIGAEGDGHGLLKARVIFRPDFANGKRHRPSLSR